MIISPYNDRMIEVLIYIQKNLDNDIKVEKLAEIACFSPAHFHRIFKTMVGESLQKHIRRLKLEKAAYSLTYSQKNISEIAYACGYESPETFSRAFKKQFHKTPSEFREQHLLLLDKNLKFDIHYTPSPSVENLPDSPFKLSIKIEEKPSMSVAFIRHIGKYADVGVAWDKICSWAAKNNVISEDTKFLGISHDDPTVTPEDKIRYDSCITCEPFETDDLISFQTLPGGKYLVATHIGPFTNLKDAHQTIHKDWLPTTTYEAQAPYISYENYVTDPEITPEEKLITEINILIK